MNPASFERLLVRTAPRPGHEQILERVHAFLSLLECRAVFGAHNAHLLRQALELRLPGLYLQLRTDGTVYIGKSDDLYRRALDHEESGLQLLLLALFPFTRRITAQELDDAETELITQAVSRELPLANAAKVALAKARLQERWRRETFSLFAVEKLQAWFHSHFFAAPTANTHSIGATASEAKLYHTVMSDAHWARASLVLRHFVRECLPLAHDLLGRRWNLAVQVSEKQEWQGAAIYAGADTVFSMARGENDKLFGSLLVSLPALEQFWDEPLSMLTQWGVEGEEVDFEDQDQSLGQFLVLAAQSQPQALREQALAAAQQPWSLASRGRSLRLTGSSGSLLELLREDPIRLAAATQTLTAMQSASAAPRGHLLLAQELL